MHFSQYPFKISWLPENQRANLQAGIGVSSRQFKKAVDRNKIKRLMREAWRLQKNTLRECLVEKNKNLSVFIIYIGKEIPDFALVNEKTGRVIRRLQKLMDEQS